MPFLLPNQQRQSKTQFVGNMMHTTEPETYNYDNIQFTFAGGRRSSATVGATLTVRKPLTSHQSRTTLDLLEQNFQQFVARQRLADHRQALRHVLPINQCYNQPTNPPITETLETRDG